MSAYRGSDQAQPARIGSYIAARRRWRREGRVEDEDRTRYLDYLEVPGNQDDRTRRG